MTEAGEVVGGKYRLQLRLGAGGGGEVWSATNRFTERQVAIKLLAREMAERQPDAKQRFLNESKVSARVDHPNIVDVIDVGQTGDGRLYLVMDLLTGVSLETALRRQLPRMTQRELAIVMLDVAGALEAAHAAGIIHRDLKPSNVFLHKSKDRVVPMLLDFGVSKFLTNAEGEVAQSITQPGTVLGSPLYMSPEQARGETELDGRTDIFAFGGILFEALTGFRAYEASNFNALIVKIATGRPKSIDACAPDVPESVRKIVRACLEPDLSKRVRSFGDVIFLIRAALPDLAVNGQRLPPAQTPAALVDPDATNALPVFGSPRPVKTERMRQPVREQVVEHTAHEAAPRLPVRASPWVVLAFAVFVIVTLAIVSSDRETPFVAMPAPTAPAVTTGLLVVVSEPPGCALAIDNAERGTTPTTTTLTVGDHTIACRPPSGAVRQAVVTVRPGSTSRYRFVFEP